MKRDKPMAWYLGRLVQTNIEIGNQRHTWPVGYVFRVCSHSRGKFSLCKPTDRDGIVRISCVAPDFLEMHGNEVPR